MKYKVKEIFSSIQGEGFNTGKKCIFVRFSGVIFGMEIQILEIKQYVISVIQISLVQMEKMVESIF